MRLWSGVLAVAVLAGAPAARLDEAWMVPTFGEAPAALEKVRRDLGAISTDFTPLPDELAGMPLRHGSGALPVVRQRDMVDRPPGASTLYDGVARMRRAVFHPVRDRIIVAVGLQAHAARVDQQRRAMLHRARHMMLDLMVEDQSAY